MSDSIEITPNQIQHPKRKVSFLLGLGIFIFPLFCVWFTLKPGYSTFARCMSFGWLAFLVILPFTIPATENQNSLSVKTQEVSTISDNKIEDISENTPVTTETEEQENSEANISVNQNFSNEEMEAEIRRSKEFIYGTANIDMTILAEKHCMYATKYTEEACLQDVIYNKLPQHQNKRIAEEEAKIRAKYASAY